MTTPRMRTDLRPLCPAHNTQMVPAHSWLEVDTDVFPKSCYACEEPDCLYCYDIVHGYFTVREGECIEHDMKYRQRCTHDGLTMYLADFEAQGSKRTWRCGQMGCKGSRITEGLPQASTAAP